jgi:hypothetical protein
MPAPVILSHFSAESEFSDPWNTFLQGNGQLESRGDSLRLVTRSCTAGEYSNAQIDDYQQLPRNQFLWQPPLTLTVRARFSHSDGKLRGTAGFGFWNDPFMMTGKRRPTLPRAIWFFYSSPPSNMKLDLHTPGPGWKAATIDAIRWPFFALLPTAPLAIPLMNINVLYRRCWPVGQRAIGVREALLPVEMTDWHTYQLAWGRSSACFRVDGQSVLASNTAPGGRLGFVLWLDNQFMIATPWGKFGAGLLDAPGEQWLETSEISIAPE